MVVQRDRGSQLSESSRAKVDECEAIIDLVLKMNGGYASLILRPLMDPAVRGCLEDMYRRAGWHVEFTQSTAEQFYINIMTPKRS